MIRKIIAWIKERWYQLIGKTTVQDEMKVEIAISDAMMEALELWGKLYENNADWVDNKSIFSLNLAAAIASEIARITTIEAKVVIENSPRADFLSQQFEKIWDKLREIVEFGAAKGGIVLKPYVDNKEIGFDFVHADQFYPIRFDSNGRIVECIFVDQRKKNDKYYTRLEHHNLTDKGVEVKNAAFVSDNSEMLGNPCDLSLVDEWAELEEDAIVEGVTQPLFGYIRSPGANNIDPRSPLGVSCFSRATDLIRKADEQWSNFLWEFDSGKRALYVDSLAFGKDSDGKSYLPNKRLYRTLETSSIEGDLFQDWSPTFRQVDLLAGLDAILKKIEFNCGIAYGVLSNPQTIDKTATEIKSSQQRTYSAVVDNQKAIEKGLDDLLYAMDIWTSLSKLAPKGKYTATYKFDDSVIVDTDLRFQQDLRLVGTQIMSKMEFRMRNFGEDEATAKERLAEVKAEQPEDLYEQKTAGGLP